MPIFDFLRNIATKRQTTPEKWLDSSVRVVTAGQQGASKPPFNHQRAVDSCRSWVYAAASINANAVASVPIRLYARKGTGQKLYRTRSVPRSQKAYMLGDASGGQRPSNHVLRKVADFGADMEEVTESHPIIDLLSTANPFLNGFDLTVIRTLYTELTGNAYLHPVIDEKTGLPAELWPLAPQFTEVIPDEDEFIRGYLYGVSSDKKQVFERDEVIHFKRPNPGNLYYGLGKVEAAYGAVLANVAMHDMDLATFQNSARPDYAVVVRGTPTSDQLDRFQEQVEQRLRGTRKDGSFIAVTGDVQFTPLNFPPKDLAGREEIVEEIAAVFGVPISMLKANDPNLASAKTGFASWREGTILPLLRMDEEELNQTLLPLFGLEDDLCLAYDNPVPSDKEFELRERQIAVAGGWRTINEARTEEGKDEFDENEFASQLLYNGQPLGQSAQQPAPGGLGGLDFGAIPGGEAKPQATENQAPDAEFAAKVLADVRAKLLQPYSATKLIQTAGFPRSVAEKMVEAEEKAQKIERTEDDLYETPEQAEAVAALLGCRGHHTHDVDGRTMYMPCGDMADYERLTNRQHQSEDNPALVDAKCRDGDCGCDYGGKPRPKASSLRRILDGGEMETLTKTLEGWNLFVKDGDNCGTGAGGFKEGNVCATGSGAQDQPKSGKAKQRFEDVKEQVDKLVGESTPLAISFELATIISGLPPEEQARALSYLQDKSLPWAGLSEDATFTNVSEDGFEPLPTTMDSAETEEYAFSEGVKYLREVQEERFGDAASAAEYALTGAGRRLAYDVAMKNASNLAEELGISEQDLVLTEISRLQSLMRPTDEANTQVIVDTVAEISSMELDADVLNMSEEKIRKVLQGSLDLQIDQIVLDEQFDEWNDSSPRVKMMIAKSYEQAERFERILGDDIRAKDRIRQGLATSAAVQKHFAKQGVDVRVDPAMFVADQFVFLPSLQEEGIDSKAMRLGKTQRAFFEVAALQHALNQVSAAGHDLRGLSIEMIERGSGAGITLHGDESTQGYWHPSDGQITLPVDTQNVGMGSSVANRTWLSEVKPVDDYVAVHEVGHALHNRALKKSGLTGRVGFLAQNARTLLGRNLRENKIHSVNDPKTDNQNFLAGGSQIWFNEATQERIRARVSGYARTDAAEYVAECFALKTRQPDKWASLSSAPVWKGSEQSLYTERFGDMFDSDEMEELLEERSDEAQTISFGQLYEWMGGV